MPNVRKKNLIIINLSLLESETIFSRKIISVRKKKKLLLWIYAATFKSFVVQWSAKITGRWPQLKPLVLKSQNS